MRNYYAVTRGFEKGLYDNWTLCQPAISDYPYPKYRGFMEFAAAKDYILDDMNLSAEYTLNIQGYNGKYSYWEFYRKLNDIEKDLEEKKKPIIRPFIFV